MRNSIRVILTIVLTLLAAIMFYTLLYGRYTGTYFPGVDGFVVLPARHLVAFALLSIVSAATLYALFFRMGKVKAVLQKIKMRIKLLSFVVAILLLPIIVFALLYRDYISYYSVLFERQSQHFYQEELYRNLSDFDYLGDGVILSTSDDPWIDVALDYSLSGHLVIIDIDDLRMDGESIESTSAQIYFALPGHSHSDESYLPATISNGVNIIEIPYGYYGYLRLDLAILPGVSMVVNGASFQNYYPLSSDFWLSFIILVALSVVFVLALKAIISEKWQKRKRKSEVDANKPTIMRGGVQVLYYVAALLMPNIFLFILFNQNRILNHIPFSHTLAWAGMFSVVGLGLFWVLRWVVRSFEARLVVSIVFWIVFWLFGSMFSAISSYIVVETYAVLLTAQLAFLLVAVWVVIRVQQHLNKANVVFSTLAFIICVLFIFNLYPGVRDEITLGSAQHRLEETAVFKTDFFVDESLPKPDIYWFHMDGMMCFETTENFFDISLDNERYELERLGFVVNSGARHNVMNTESALASLFSPSIYDSFYGQILAPLDNLPSIQTSPEPFGVVLDALWRHGVSLHEINQNNELFGAFISADYRVVVNADITWFNYFPFHRIHYFYNQSPTEQPLGIPTGSVRTGVLSRIFVGDLARVLSVTTPLAPILDPNAFSEDVNFYPISDDRSHSLPVYASGTERQLYVNLIDSFNITEPKINLITFMHFHQSYWPIPHRYYSYTQALHNGFAVMLNAINIVLAENPDAIIILQADHGIHGLASQGPMYDAGYSLDTIAELQRSVISAVRIPEQYGGLDAPLDPRNISRELINRFVGGNYELLP